MQYQNWSELYAHNAPKLLGICRRYIQDVSTAEDVLHDAFIKAIEHENRYNGDGKIEAWLCRIVINTTLSHIKNSKKYKEVAHEDVPELIEDSTEKNEKTIYFTQEDVLAAIDQLPIHHKTVFNLYVIDEFTHIQISEMLQITVNTSKSHLLRARKKIQEILSKEKKKKRRIAAMFFISNNIQEMEKQIREAFKDFAIQPKKPFPAVGNVPHNPKFFKQIHNSDRQIANKIFGTNLLAMCIALLFIAFNYASDSLTHSSSKNVSIFAAENRNSPNSTQIRIVNSEESKIAVETYDTDENEVSNTKTTNQTIVATTKPQSQHDKPQLTNKIENKIAFDSVKTTSRKQPVIIYKKRTINKTDTLYVD